VKDLIQRLRSDSYMEDEVRSFAREAADALERLTAGNVDLPKAPWPHLYGWNEAETEAITDYGNHKDAAGYLRGVQRCIKACGTVSTYHTLSDPAYVEGKQIAKAECIAAIRKVTP
jgi:hypothetical protein